jgi:hypothetical protein
MIRGCSGTLLAVLVCLACSCGGGSTPGTPPGVDASAVTIALVPTTASVPTGGLQQFTATVSNATNATVTWQVNDVAGGNAATGVISNSGLYTAPGAVPNPATITVKAIAQADTSKTASASVTITNLSAGDNTYVSTTGSDSNPGTMALPWRTIQHAANTVRPGSTVNVRAGIYNEIVRVGVSGSAAGGTTIFRSYPGEVAILDGSAPTRLSAGGDDCGLFTVENQSYVVIQGFELRNFTTSHTTESPAGILVRGTGSHIQILNNHIHDVTTTASDSPSKMASSAFGIAVKGTALTNALTDITIDGNELDHLKTGASESMTINGNIDGFTVTNNRVHDNNNIGIDCIGHEGVNGSPEGNTDPNDAARNGVVSGNTVYNISSYGNPAYGTVYAADGIYVDGGNHIVIERNVVHDTDINVEVASEWPGNTASYVTVRNNLIYNALACGISIGGYDSRRGGTDHCDFVNNTLYSNDTRDQGCGELQIQYFATNNRFENNIVYAKPNALFINPVAGSSSGVVIDYNLFYSIGGGSAVGAHSKFGDPMFVSTSTPDFHVSPSSPAVGAGNDLGVAVEGGTDLAGKPRVVNALDMGAYEQ